MKAKILIVEDEPAIVDAIQYALEEDGCETRVLFQGGEVMALLAREHIDLIVLDIGLPDMSGLELIKEIRPRFDVPVIFLTARASEIDRILGLELGGDDYVVKPFSPRELAARVKAVLRRGRGRDNHRDNSQDAPVASVWRVDDEKRRVFYRGLALELSRYEYNLLRVLLERPGRVLTREQLMRRAWDEPEASMDRTVDAHIKNIRAKVKAIDPADDSIITHRGIGYSFKESP